MRPRNFPARKLARQIAVRTRNRTGAPVRAADLLAYWGYDRARAVRTKKRRASV